MWAGCPYPGDFSVARTFSAVSVGIAITRIEFMLFSLPFLGLPLPSRLRANACIFFFSRREDDPNLASKMPAEQLLAVRDRLRALAAGARCVELSDERGRPGLQGRSLSLCRRRRGRSALQFRNAQRRLEVQKKLDRLTAAGRNNSMTVLRARVHSCPLQLAWSFFRNPGHS